MGVGNTLFTPTIDSIFQGVGTVKMWSVHHYGAQYSYFHGNIDSASYLLSQVTNHKPSQMACLVVFLDTGRSTKLRMVAMSSSI